MSHYTQDEVNKCVSLHGMEATLHHLIQRVRAEPSDEPYLKRLIADLEVALDNYKRRNS